MNFWFGLSWVILLGVIGLFAADVTGVLHLTAEDGPGLLLFPLTMSLLLTTGAFMAKKSARRLWAGQVMVVLFGVALMSISWTYRSILTPDAVASSVHGTVARLSSAENADRLMPKPAEALGKGEVRVRRGAGGHFWVNARIHGKLVRFLVDTGASYIALTKTDAMRLGFQMKDLDFSQTAQTPNGPVNIAAVRLKDVQVSSLQVKNLRAAVLDSDIRHSLLGMNFLKHLKQFEIRGDILHMRQ